MAGINKVFIVGRVGKDPEIRTFHSGDQIASFSLATSQTWKDKNSGERKERTEWHTVVVRNSGIVGVVEQYVSKGSLVGVIGELQTRKWEKDGIDRYSTEVVIAPFGGELHLLGSKNDGNGERGERQQSSRSSSQSSSSSGGGFGGGGGFASDMDDQIPFFMEWR